MLYHHSISNTVLIIFNIYNLQVCISEQSTSTIKQVNVLFRHGDRTPLNLYPNIPYTREHYFPAGVGGLTNNGKKRAYELGEMLRKRYDAFLGSIYMPEDVQAFSTDFDRTKMSLQLVLAGLYPPNSLQKWNSNLNWQPIPTHYKSVSEDHLFQPNRQCKLYHDEQEKIRKSSEVAEMMFSFDNLVKNVSLLTGRNMTDVFSLAGFYADLECLETMGLDLPNWIYEFFPQGPLLDVMFTVIDVFNYNVISKRLHGGKFVRQILENMLAVTDTFHTVEKDPKIYLYSGHDINVAALLSSLNLIIDKNLSKFSSAVIIELLSVNSNYYVKVNMNPTDLHYQLQLYHLNSVDKVENQRLYQQNEIWYYLGIPPITKEIKIPNCQIPCPLEVFRNLTKDVTPSDEEFLCV